jgi:DNA-binding NtrC family response regulator
MIPVSDVFQGMYEIKKRKEVELIIVDVDYHTQENWDFIQHIKTSGLYQDIPVIVLMTDESKRMSGKMAESVYNFFYKPFSPLDIIRTIDELMFTNKIHN